MDEYLRGMQLAVETPTEGVCTVWVTGELTAATGPRLLRLLDGVVARMALAGPPARVLVDLANVRRFELDGVAALRHAHHRGVAGGVRLVLGGLADRRYALPRRVDEALDLFDCAPV